MRGARGLPDLPYATLRPHAGSGARGMLGAALTAAPGQPAYESLRQEFLALYEARMLRHTKAFAQTAEVVDGLAMRKLPWGVVTNKALRLATPLAQALGLHPGARVLVGGDSTPHTKPHPARLWRGGPADLGLPPSACVYVGDDLRDIQAGRAAGMATLAAAWGYLGPRRVCPRLGRRRGAAKSKRTLEVAGSALNS